MLIFLTNPNFVLKFLNHYFHKHCYIPFESKSIFFQKVAILNFAGTGRLWSTLWTEAWRAPSATTWARRRSAPPSWRCCTSPGRCGKKCTDGSSPPPLSSNCPRAPRRLSPTRAPLRPSSTASCTPSPNLSLLSTETPTSKLVRIFFQSSIFNLFPCFFFIVLMQRTKISQKFNFCY